MGGIPHSHGLDVPFDVDAPPGAQAPGAGRGRSAPPPGMPWEQARAVARRAASRPLPALGLGLSEALGHALAEPLVALTDLPPFDTSAMDGWAVAGPGPWRLCGRVLAGQGRPRLLADGTAARIATGAQLPPGATAVLRREHGTVTRRGPEWDGDRDKNKNKDKDEGGTTVGGGGKAASDDAGGVLHARASRSTEPGRDVRPRGQECRRGEPLLAAATVVTPVVLGLAAAAGYDRLTVHRRPTVELLLLGDELLDSGLPRGGRVRDALGPLLRPWLSACGAEVVGRRLVKDDLGLLSGALRNSAADVLVTTGSTAAGPADFLHTALAEAGARLLVDSVAVRPGHPMLLAELPSGSGAAPRRLVGLPGNPLAAVAGAATLAAPLLRALAGQAVRAPRWVPAAAELEGHPDDTRLLPVRLSRCGAEPLAFDGPAMLRGLALADALAVVPPGGVPAGTPAEVLEVPGR